VQRSSKDTKPEIVFVNYLSRSGSTLLCKLLDSYKGISVGIEAGFPGAVKRLVPNEYREINNDGHLARYLDELYRDVRFRDWNVDRQCLINRLQKAGYPLTFKDILQACLEEYFGDIKAEIYVHKAGYYIDVLDDVRAAFGEHAKNVFIIRDPRAIYSSQGNATCVYTGQAMGRCLSGFVYQYKRRVRIVARETSKTLLCIRYEDLVRDTDKVIKKVLSFLGMPDAEFGGDNYAARIPNGQKHLHVNVSTAPNAESFEKWRATLKDHEVQFIQKKLASEMKLLGYTPVQLDGLGVRDLMPYIVLELKYLYASLLRAVGFL